jgi:four helix bundle protein
VGVRRIEDLVAYTLSVELRRAVYQLAREHPAVNRDYRYRDQLFDAVASAPANIAEGFGRRTTVEFCRFLAYARGSVAETQNWLQDGADRGYFSEMAAADANTLARRTAAAVAGLQRSLKPFLPPNRR